MHGARRGLRPPADLDIDGGQGRIDMWIFWLIPTLSFGFAVAVLYRKVIRETPLYAFAAQAPEVVPRLPSQTALEQEKAGLNACGSLQVPSGGEPARGLEMSIRSQEKATNIGQRRSPRVVCDIPLTLSLGSRSLAVRSAVINAYGVLILCSEPIPEGTPVALFNEKTGTRVEASVVWKGGMIVSLASPTLGQFKIGVEFRRLARDFWGLDYNP
jgi:hypothetical protein